jgi:hypothetical protein
MEHGNAGLTATEDQHVSAAMARLSVLAAQEITSHTCKDGMCVICGTAWPCERAELAEHNLALL